MAPPARPTQANLRSWLGEEVTRAEAGTARTDLDETRPVAIETGSGGPALDLIGDLVGDDTALGVREDTRTRKQLTHRKRDLHIVTDGVHVSKTSGHRVSIDLDPVIRPAQIRPDDSPWRADPRHVGQHVEVE